MKKQRKNKKTLQTAIIAICAILTICPSMVFADEASSMWILEDASLHADEIILQESDAEEQAQTQALAQSQEQPQEQPQIPENLSLHDLIQANTPEQVTEQPTDTQDQSSGWSYEQADGSLSSVQTSYKTTYQLGENDEADVPSRMPSMKNIYDALNTGQGYQMLPSPFSGPLIAEESIMDIYNKMEGAPTNDELYAMAVNLYGMSMNDFIVVLGWAQNENTQGTGAIYLGYLSACIPINLICEGQNPASVGGSDTRYTMNLFNQRAQEAQYDAVTRKVVYIALLYRSTLPYSSHGIVVENGYSPNGSVHWTGSVQRLSDALYYAYMPSVGIYGAVWAKNAPWVNP